MWWDGEFNGRRKLNRWWSADMKSQRVRLLDVFLLGPFLMWAATRPTLGATARQVLWWSGFATVLYNGANYLARRR